MLLLCQEGFSGGGPGVFRKCYPQCTLGDMLFRHARRPAGGPLFVHREIGEILRPAGAEEGCFMDGGAKDLAALLPNIAAQARGALSSLRLAAAQLAPAEAREQNPDLDRQAALLDQSYYRLLRLVNNLSLAACMDGDRPLHLQDRDLVDLIGEQCERTAGLAELLGLQLKFICQLERHICAVDPDILEQILTQLLSNALKFTDRGGSITVELRLLPKRVLISVEDTGCGIPEDQLTMLFDRYLHDIPPDRPAQGLGLGLALCQRLAALHNGALMAVSRPGQGSRFTLSLPDRQVGSGVSDVAFDYSGGFNRTLLGLADALPPEAFLIRSQD